MLTKSTPKQPNKADAVRARLAESGITECDMADAVKWARRSKGTAKD